MKNLANFHQSMFESLKTWTFIGFFYPSRKLMSLKFTGEFMLREWRMLQNLKSTWLVNSKFTWGIWQILTWALRNLKNLPFNGQLLTKVYVWAKKKYRGVMFDCTEDWCEIWRKTDLYFLKRHEEFGIFLFISWKTEISF